jgi:hypothetical protein
LKPKVVFTFEIIIKRPFGHTGGIQNFLDSGMVKSFAMNNFSPGFNDSVSGVLLHAHIPVGLTAEILTFNKKIDRSSWIVKYFLAL